ncbi:MAG: ATP:cob(I)alamin adenosyltransferase [Pyrobaculum sp.]
MVMIKPCLLWFSCPGDNGDTVVLWKGEARRARKDDPYIKLFGALDTAIAYSHKAANMLQRPQARVMRLIAFSLMELGFYMATGRAEYLEAATALYKRAVKYAYVLTDGKMPSGWVACSSQECSAVDEARVWIRWTERRVVTLGDEMSAKLLNHLSNLAFEVMATLPHIGYRHKNL